MFCGNSVSWLVDYKVWSEKNVKKKKKRKSDSQTPFEAIYKNIY